MVTTRFYYAVILVLALFGATAKILTQDELPKRVIPLPSSKILRVPVPGEPQKTNSLPVAVALSPDSRYMAILNNGYGTQESGYEQSIAILDLRLNALSDYPEARLGTNARQTYFLGLAFSADGKKLYASIASLTDPLGEQPGDLGNGVALYNFQDGHLTPNRFIKLPLRSLGSEKRPTTVSSEVPKGQAVPYPAGLAVVAASEGERLLVGENLADDAVLLDVATGKILHRFDLSTGPDVPATYPYAVIATRDGKVGFCSLWNASRVVQLDLETGRVTRWIPVLAPGSSTAAGSHPTALLLSPDEKYLYVTLSNSDRVAVLATESGKGFELLSTELPGQKYGGSFPNALAQTADGTRLFVANASADAVAVFDMGTLRTGQAKFDIARPQPALGFIPTEWYPTALAVRGDDLLILTGKGKGTGPNTRFPAGPVAGQKHPHIKSLLYGSVARLSIREVGSNLAALTREVEESNLMRSAPEEIRFPAGGTPIRHVIYIMKENRTYDQVFGDLKPGDGDPSLCLYCEDITPNEHRLARQFGILDNFYDSGEVSGDGHVWSMAAITSDYTEKTWQIVYRGHEHTYDYDGEVAHAIALDQGLPDVNEPGTGYIWANVQRHGLTHRDYGEFVRTSWCRSSESPGSSRASGAPRFGETCPRAVVHQGEPLPPNVGQPHGSPSPWPWPVPLFARSEATKAELRGHIDPHYVEFRLDYPDQLRVDEFLNEFEGFVRARQEGKGTELPQFVILYLPNDHTSGTKPGMPRPAAMVTDNDLALGRVIEAVSHSPYWDDTAIFVVEDDAQDGADHVDAHRSIALVISKYSPGSAGSPFVDHHFYTTVSMVRTMEALLGLPPMNNNDAQAPVMAPLFSGPGNQPPFTADSRNRDNGLIYQVNPPTAPGARESAQLDFSRPDSANAARLNAILWRDRKGDLPMPVSRHRRVGRGTD